jgi:hypothetical protein
MITTKERRAILAPSKDVAWHHLTAFAQDHADWEVVSVGTALTGRQFDRIVVISPYYRGAALDRFTEYAQQLRGRLAHGGYFNVL